MNAIVTLPSLMASNHGSYLLFTGQLVVLELFVQQIWPLYLVHKNK